MNSGSSSGARPGSPGPPGVAVENAREVVERLMVVLEQVVRAPRPVRRGHAGAVRVDVRVGAARRRRRGCRAVRPARAGRRRRRRSTSRPRTTPSRRRPRSARSPIVGFVWARQQCAERARRLEDRLHRVDAVVAAGGRPFSGAGSVATWRRSQSALGRPAWQRDRRRVERLVRRHPVGVEHRVPRRVGAARRAGRVDRRGRRDQPLVVQERPAERGLEEVVLDRVVGMALVVQVLVDRQRLRVVDALVSPIASLPVM